MKKTILAALALSMLVACDGCDYDTKARACRNTCEPRVVKEISRMPSGEVKCVCDEKFVTTRTTVE